MNIGEQKTSNSDVGASEDATCQSLEEVLHVLANKLLPVLVYSELGLHRCQDAQFREHFDKILRSANEARDIVNGLRERCKTNSDTNVASGQL